MSETFDVIGLFSEQWLNNILTMVTVVIPVAVLVWYKIKSNFVKQQSIVIGEYFRGIVEKISTGSDEQKMASAVLLRRFFDPDTEFGINRMPYAKDCVAVTCAFLKVMSTSNLQKILADNLRYAPRDVLETADFQRANLSKAYLGSDSEKDGIDLSGLDFYQANLSGASLKYAKIEGSQFFEAHLANTVLKSARLDGASFRSASLNGVVFDEASLNDVCFADAKIVNCRFNNARLKGCDFLGATGYGNKGLPPECGFSENELEKDRMRIFLSRPGSLDSRQEKVLSDIKSSISHSGSEIVELTRDCYDASNVLSKLKEMIKECDAFIVVGFSALHVVRGEYRSSTEDHKTVEGQYLSTPWNQIEAGMAAMEGKPTLLIHENVVTDGVFEPGLHDNFIDQMTVDEIMNKDSMNIQKWLDRVSGK